MGGRFSSGCAATYIFVLRPTSPGSNADTKSGSYRFNKSIKDDESTKAFDIEEALELLHRCMSEVEIFMRQVNTTIERTNIDLNVSKRKHKLNFKKSHKKNAPTGGEASIYCDLPTELDMADNFKRIKLAINYIAKLKYHLYQPNAPELIHRLFGHLSICVRVCHNYSRIYSPGLPSRTLLPLLSRDSVRFLRLSLISQEMDLWKSLGKAWTQSRDEWKGEGSMCNAVLLEGWEACYPPNGSIVHNQPWNNRSRHRSGNTESETATFASEESRSMRSRLS